MKTFGAVRDQAVIASVSVATTWMAATKCTSMYTAPIIRQGTAAASLEVSHLSVSLQSKDNVFAANLEAITS